MKAYDVQADKIVVQPTTDPPECGAYIDDDSPYIRCRSAATVGELHAPEHYLWRCNQHRDPTLPSLPLTFHSDHRLGRS